MDNIQEPVVAPQGEAQPTESQVPNVQGDGATSQGQEAPQGTTFQELAAKKGFKSPDDLAKAYTNLEGHSTRVAQERAELEKQFFNSNPSQQQIQDKRQELAAQGDEAALAELDKFVNQRVNQEVSKIRAEWQDKESRRELRETIEKNPDFGKYAQDVKSVKEQYPNMSFQDALVFVKAQKGDLANEARIQGMTRGAEAIAQQQQAQVVPSKSGSEQKITANEILEGAGKRWAPNSRGQVDPRAVAEIEQIEKELFGFVLKKTDSGL